MEFPVPRVENQAKSGEEQPLPCTALVHTPEIEVDLPAPRQKRALFKIARAAVLVLAVSLWAFNAEPPEPQQAQNTPPTTTKQIEKVTTNSVKSTEEEIDYDEWINRVPLRKPAKPSWVPDWMSQAKSEELVG